VKFILLQCIVSGEKTPELPHSPWDFVTLPDEDRAMAIGNMDKKFGTDRACGSRDILTDRQTDTLITILRNRSRRRSNHVVYIKTLRM